MKFKLSFLLLLLCLPQLVWSEWIKVTGRAPVKNIRYEVARESARDDAFQQAVMQFGTQVKSRQRIENGVLKQDELILSSTARVNKSVIEEEYVWEGMLHLSMNVDVEAISACPNSQASGYKKQVAVLGFTIQSPAQANLGAIHNVERGLSSALNQALQNQGQLIVFEHSQFIINSDVINAPSKYTPQNTLTNAADFAKEVGAQFVVSGVVRDIGIEEDAAFSNSYWAKLKRLVRKANQNRHFTVELFVHDGFSGELIWQKQFSTKAKWAFDTQQKVGFGSAEFWQGQYGQAVSGVVDEMAGLVGEQLKCQPFMTRISRVDGKTLHFDSGASSGVRPGDKLSLYRTFNFSDSDMQKGIELINVKTALTVSQVHPGFSSGKIAVDPGRLNIQEDDLLIAW